MNNKIAKKIRRIAKFRNIPYKVAKRYFEQHPELRTAMENENDFIVKKLVVKPQ